MRVEEVPLAGSTPWWTTGPSSTPPPSWAWDWPAGAWPTGWGPVPPDLSQPLSTGAEEYLSWLAVEKGRSRNTLAAYRRDIAGLGAAGHRRPGSTRLAPAPRPSSATWPSCGARAEPGVDGPVHHRAAGPVPLPGRARG